MANRNTKRNIASMEPAPVILYGRVAIGATGAPTLNKINSLGMYSMTRTGAGAYTINLGLNATSVDTYQRVMDMNCISVNGSIPAWATFYIVADNSANKAAPNVQIQFLAAAGTAVDPSNGENIRFKIALSNSTAV